MKTEGKIKRKRHRDKGREIETGKKTMDKDPYTHNRKKMREIE